MAMQKFRFGNLPIPPADYSPEHFRQAFRILEIYFNQLDSNTPCIADSYTALNFFGGNFIGNFVGGDATIDTATVNLLNAITANIQLARIYSLYADYAESKALLANRIESGDIASNNFYGGLFAGNGYGLKLPHIAASDTTDQIADGDDTPTLVTWNTLDSGYGWTLNSPGSATAAYTGVYKITYSLQFVNTDNTIHYATVWLRVNTNDVANSSTTFAVPARKSATPGEEGFICAYSEITFTVAAGDEIELYWVTNKAGDPGVPTDGVYMLHDPAQTTPYARPAIPSAVGSITFMSALNQTKVAPLPVFGLGQVGAVSVLTNLG